VPTTSMWIVTALAACGPASDGSGSPSLSVDNTLVFDGVHIGTDVPAVEQVWVENVGHGTLFVDAPYFAEDGAFSVSGESATLEPMEGHAYDVTFDPQVPFVQDASLVFASNDPTGPLRAVAAHGEGFAPVLEIATSPIDLGSAEVGCGVGEEIEVRNGGNEVLVVTPSLAGTSPEELSLANGTDPIEIQPSMAATILLAYQPLDAVADAATLTLESNDPLLPEIAIDVTGAGKLSTQSDIFELNSRASDIVLVVDKSSSMDVEAPQLVDHIGAFVAELDDAAVDYRIAVITNDNASFRGDVVTPGDPLALLTDHVDAGTEGTKSGAELALQMLYDCVQPGGDCSHDAGFMRNDALFVGIIISDGPDQSAMSPEDYTDYFWTLKDDPDLVRIHALAGAIPVVTCSTCSSPGYAYQEAQELTGGVYLDICTDDWDEALSTLADQSSPQTGRTVELSEDPVVETIQVSVDGVLWMIGWSYTGHVADGGTNEIEFDDPLPILSVVEVSYTLTAACE